MRKIVNPPTQVTIPEKNIVTLLRMSVAGMIYIGNPRIFSVINKGLKIDEYRLKE